MGAPIDANASLAGRHEEISLLSQSLHAAAQGQLAVALLTGEPGIGKTRLLETLAQRAQAEGFIVLRGGAFEAEGMPPYLPFLEALGDHVRRAPTEQVRAELGPYGGVLSAILPEIAVQIGKPSAPQGLPPEQARMRLYEAVAAFLAGIADTAPLLLILDDLQWADPASLDLLRYLVRRQRQCRLCVVGAYRSGEIAHRAEFERTLAELEQLRLLRTLPIGPLGTAEIAQVARRELQAALAPDAVQTLLAQSEGNPFFVEELLRDWRATGLLQPGDAAWQLRADAAELAEVAAPPSIMRVIRQRLGRLSPELRALLRTAAIIGRRVDPAVLAEAAGIAPDELDLHLLAAVEAQLLRPAGDVLLFAHDKIRECLYDEVTPTQRQRLHGLVGGALEQRGQPNDHRILADLAWHFARSGDRARGVTYSRRALIHALQASAPQEAKRHGQTALALLPAGDPQRGGLLLELGEAALLASDEAAAIPVLSEAQHWFRETQQPILAGRAAHLLGQARWRQEQIPAAQTAFAAAVALLQDGPSAGLVAALIDLGSLLVVSEHQDEVGIAYLERAVLLAQGAGEPRLLAAANRALGNLLVRRNDLPGGIALLEQALQMAIAADDAAEAAECCAGLAPAYYWQGNIARSEAISLRRLAFAEASHDSYQLRHVYTWLATCEAVRGRIAQAEEYLHLADSIVARLESPEPRAFVTFVRGGLALVHGDLAAAERYFAAALPIWRSIGPNALVWYLGFASLLPVAQGDAVAAAACLDELMRLLEAIPSRDLLTGESVAAATHIALFLGDDVCLAQLKPRLLRAEGQFRDLVVDRLLGEIALREGDLPAASRYLAAAETLARREHLTWELAHTLDAQANLALAIAGSHALGMARECLTEARDLLAQWENNSEARLLEARLAALDQPASLPAGLSAREVDVLRLVAQGWSNRAIALELSLSAKTIEHHLTSIYGKLAVDNRAAAAAFAVRQGLA